ncbi:unnamed protein product [Ranitomeya imitator]|uniref:Uncharacterized protein n=1 Tax=Ranitomeya imitator TaxID=111125 RepID=A0ABN9ME25_9NEOB|nr:unnamed protein product [Ranitomeya imitator]
MDELELMLLEHNYDMVGITETWLDESHDWAINLQGYSLFRNDRTDKRGGGVAPHNAEIVDGPPIKTQGEPREITMRCQEAENLSYEFILSFWKPGKQIYPPPFCQPAKKVFTTFRPNAEAERRRHCTAFPEDTDSPVSGLVALSQRIHSSYMSTFHHGQRKDEGDILTGKSSISPPPVRRVIILTQVAMPEKKPNFVIYDMECPNLMGGRKKKKERFGTNCPTQNPLEQRLEFMYFTDVSALLWRTVRALTDFAKSISRFQYTLPQ